MKWRKVKKKIKRDVLPGMIGTYVAIEPSSGCPMRICDVKIAPAGNGKVEYRTTVEPMDKELFLKYYKPTPEKVYHAPISEHIRSGGFNLSFDIQKIDNDSLNKSFGI